MSRGERAKNPVGRPRQGGPDTRSHVLDRAEALLAVRGYAGVSMDEVARAAGITKGTLYHHFPGGKDGLILAVGHRSLERHRAGLAAAITGPGDTRSRLEAVAHWVLGGRGGPEQIVRDAVRFLPPHHAEEMARAFGAQVYGPVRALLEEGVSRGELTPHDTEFVAWALLGLLAEFAELQTLLVRPHLAQQIVGLVLAGTEPGG